MIISFTPAIVVGIEKVGPGGNISSVKTLNYRGVTHVSITYVNYNSSQKITCSKSVLTKNITFNLNLLDRNGNISINGNSYGLSATGMKNIIFADSQSFPSDPLNENISSYGRSSFHMVHSPYEKPFGYMKTICNLYYSSIPSYALPVLNGTVLSAGSITSSVTSGYLLGGKAMYAECSSINLIGNRSCFGTDFSRLSPTERDLVGPTLIYKPIMNAVNSTYSFNMYITTTYNLESSNALFKINLTYYLEFGILTGSIFLIAAGLFLYGRRRKWSIWQSSFLPIVTIVVMSFLILPYTYMLYFPYSL